MKPAYTYGGQAVIEGVMMRGPATRAVAVRCPDETIVVDQKPVRDPARRFPFLKWPFLRGLVVLIDSLIIGIEALTYSASQAVGEEEELSTREIFFTVATALLLGVLLFIVLPTAATHFFAAKVKGSIGQNLVEGVVRVGVFLIYVIAISFMKDIQRVFQYHGAEHKVINAFEAGEELTVENVQKYSTFHPRCGTSFLLIVMVVSIVVFSLSGYKILWWRILSRVILMPVVAGVSYELLKLSGKYYRTLWCRIMIAPGKWLQKLTTREPDNGQVEVAISALKAVLKDGEASV
ncbi:protein of unknown function DUF1385 [Desulfofarcimen acetoxidans DSM 771]|uniref:DUF1385 domain-containing protein n=1 Tax=Desulfofarcimen acetoxidans (strain ATCC 49208 / DSM 771 / KCTC 5769 / VKM B-1644 / 5575) TaxID=485916 RepID=C8VVG0_DESAS|nr:DUF1385 domain-containing protein [Desulfofarcimen acetoxidans]ACV61026.1 protein of unknown function DUF1385 [Desulfofarcimen acetoxidans DSM 771]